LKATPRTAEPDNTPIFVVAAAASQEHLGFFIDQEFPQITSAGAEIFGYSGIDHSHRLHVLQHA
jgi:hypothetical protein